MGNAVDRQDLEMIKWLSSKFQGLIITSEIVNRACKAGSMEILQFFYDNDSQRLEQRGYIGVGHTVEWGYDTMAAALSGHRSDIVWWLHRHVPDADFELDMALGVALKMGDILIAEWLLSQGAEWPEHIIGYCGASDVAALGRLDVLQWMDEQGQLDGVVGLVASAAEVGHLHVIRWLVERDTGEIKKLGGEASLSIHTAAVNGHLEVAKYLRAQAEKPTSEMQRKLEVTEQKRQLQRLNQRMTSSGARVSKITITEAAMEGYLGVVQWLYTEYGNDSSVFDYGNNGLCSVDSMAMDAAAIGGHLNLLQMMHDSSSRKRKRETMPQRPRVQCSEEAMDGAATNGHLDVVQWLQEKCKEGCTTIAMDGAATNGHLEVVRWLHEHRSEAAQPTPWTSQHEMDTSRWCDGSTKILVVAVQIGLWMVQHPMGT